MIEIKYLDRTIKLSNGRVRYNSLRLQFSFWAYDAVDQFRKQCAENKENAFDLGRNVLRKITRKSVIPFFTKAGFTDVNVDTLLKDNVFEKAIAKDIQSLEKLGSALYMTIFNLHMTFYDRYKKRYPNLPLECVSAEDAIKAQEVLKNARTLLPFEEKLPKLLEEALLLNPYSRQVYHLLILNFGDEDHSVERLGSLFGFNLKGYKHFMLNEVAKKIRFDEIVKLDTATAREQISMVQEEFNKLEKFVGYEGKHPLGKKLAEVADKIKIDNVS